MKIKGYAVRFDSLSHDLGGFRERIMPGAFVDTLKNTDQILLNGHDSVRILARKSTGSLRLTEDDIGLLFEADLPNTGEGRDVFQLVNDGILQNMSFGFSVPNDPTAEDWTMDQNGEVLRTLRRINLFEVSPVGMPAYPSSTVKASGKAFRSAAVVAQKASSQDYARKHGPIGAGRARAMKQAMEARIRAKAGDVALLLDY